MTGRQDPVEAYLDQLLLELAGRTPQVRRIMAETEHHLRDAVEEGVAQGLTAEEAEQRALARFGSPRLVARRFAAQSGWLVPRTLVVQIVLALGLVGAVGFAAIGVSGALAAGMGSLFGKSFVAGDPVGLAYTPARCADFQEYFPRAGSCEEAATAHHYEEVVGYRSTAGVLGLAGLAGYGLLRRRGRVARVGVLPEGFMATVGASLFGVAAAALAVESVANIGAGSAAGMGQYLSGALVSLAVALAFLVSLWRTLARRTAVTGAQYAPQ